MLHLGLARLALPRGMRGRELPPSRRDPYQDFVFVLQPEGEKKRQQIQTTLSAAADEALFSPLPFPTSI